MIVGLGVSLCYRTETMTGKYFKKIDEAESCFSVFLVAGYFTCNWFLVLKCLFFHILNKESFTLTVLNVFQKIFPVANKKVVIDHNSSQLKTSFNQLTWVIFYQYVKDAGTKL